MTKYPPLPTFFQAERVAQVWPVPYQQRAKDAKNWTKQYHIQPAKNDRHRIALLLIDVQNTFCLPEFELYVKGAIEDNRRLCQFIYHNLPYITEIIATQDTHNALQIFHPIFWVNPEGEHPTPGVTQISLEDVKKGIWQVNPLVTEYLNIDPLYALHYVQQLSQAGKYQLTIWPYHSMLGGIGHALVSAVEEALFFHSIARTVPTTFDLKGNNPLTENYSVLRAEILEDQEGKVIAQKNSNLLERLLQFDAVIIAGQAKSHCVAWTIRDLLTEIQAKKPQFVQKVYLLEDCTSPVVVSEEIDFTELADAAFQGFAQAGMQIVKSTLPLLEYPGLEVV